VFATVLGATLGGCADDDATTSSTTVVVDGPSTTTAASTSSTAVASSAATVTSSATVAPSTSIAPGTATSGPPTTAGGGTTTPVTTSERPVRSTTEPTLPPPPPSSTIPPLQTGQQAYGYLVEVRPDSVFIDVVERFTGVEARRQAQADGVTLAAGVDVYVRNLDAEPSPFRLRPGAKVVVTECAGSQCLEKAVALEKVPVGGTRVTRFVTGAMNEITELAVPADG
jgi:hypothetical protein